MNYEETREWVRSLKVGDEVVLRERSVNHIHRVTKVTNRGGRRQVEVGGWTFNDHAWRTGTSHTWYATICPATPEIRAEVERVGRLNYVLGVPWGRLPQEVVATVYGIAKAAMDELKAKEAAEQS